MEPLERLADIAHLAHHGIVTLRRGVA